MQLDYYSNGFQYSTQSRSLLLFDIFLKLKHLLENTKFLNLLCVYEI